MAQKWKDVVSRELLKLANDNHKNTYQIADYLTHLQWYLESSPIAGLPTGLSIFVAFQPGFVLE